jgi:putative acetyltransferase
MTQLIIRPETLDDIPAIHALNATAFAREGKPGPEAMLVDALRARKAVTLSWVAVMGEAVVGHILYSPVTIVSPDASFAAVGLGPVAVGPDYQKRGIGSRLIRESLEALRGKGHGAVFLVGHPTYYPKFGFGPAARFGIDCEFEVPEEVFMALELRPNSLLNKIGKLYYQPEFKNV